MKRASARTAKTVLAEAKKRQGSAPQADRAPPGSRQQIRPSQPDVALFDLQKAIALVSTACRALESVHAERGYELTGAVGEPVETLRSGVDALHGVFPTIDQMVHAEAIRQPQSQRK